MAPTVGRRADGAVLAIGSPGADRITTALTQVLAGFAVGRADLQAAVDRPRLHLARSADGAETLHHEPGVRLPVEGAPGGPARRTHEAASMYFGGVGVALHEPGAGLSAAADPRRAGVVGFG
jgi:gamma-glutamyltranspeptidase/glutathione hydrolase